MICSFYQILNHIFVKQNFLGSTSQRGAADAAHCTCRNAMNVARMLQCHPLCEDLPGTRIEDGA